jgi:excisionase family DNA binding protein
MSTTLFRPKPCPRPANPASEIEDALKSARRRGRKGKSLSETPEQFEFVFSDNHSRRLLTKRELAAALNLSERTVDNWVAQKRIPYLRLSARLLRFSLPEVEAALARYEVKEVGARR